MKTTIIFSALIILFTGCISQNQKDNDQIKETVTEYWKAVKENDLESYNRLIYNAANYPGVTSSELFFLSKHYNIIDSKKKLLSEIKIKDTIDNITNVKMKYVQYIYKKDNNSNILKKPLIITLMFYKPVGFDKIYYPVILQNHIGWDK
ncbi:hypothetical protein HZQ19_13305 [Elizabethkingia anophelis]|uniref:hypothetical protein n=1 Tax=Elizabethkingia anophelis TaxID=1117645 RepID=UPI000C9AF43C|nr:hypothetical protein [Elizabethkingia anophelis]MCT3759795.1 hypothetical protein [Elizabethkingia anophelis]MCT3974294.1 hypothetical protein [Elizabethkingia anophelis]MCT4002966.1 hypothetical protein [Elizabethkingia anophelis]MCT4016986.1 hypothetical protein [Elizabethkingia anophelis]MCT4020421.1 hypothetical protein [Elizabethkingia anophelis]